jgi:hypothetical protein
MYFLTFEKIKFIFLPPICLDATPPFLTTTCYFPILPACFPIIVLIKAVLLTARSPRHERDKPCSLPET